MNRLNFTTRYLFALTFVVALAVYLWPKPDPNATDPKWREMLPANSKPLLNITAVSSGSIKGGLIFVTATNNGLFPRLPILSKLVLFVAYSLCPRPFASPQSQIQASPSLNAAYDRRGSQTVEKIDSLDTNEARCCWHRPVAV